MKKISEVCKITGVTRRTLQEYNKIGLLKPSAKTEGGYWLYDEEAVNTLILIQIFIEAGYERRQIQSILESNNLSPDLDHLITELKEQQKRLDGIIRYIEMFRDINKIPKQAMGRLSSIDFTPFYLQQGGFKKTLQHTASALSQYQSPTKNEYQLMMQVTLDLMTIGAFYGQSAEETLIQKQMNKLYEDAYEAILRLALQEDPDDSLSHEEFKTDFKDLIQELLSDEDLRSYMENQFGQGAVSYILEKVDKFKMEVSL